MEYGGLKNVVLVVKLQDDIILVDKRHEFVAGYRPVFVDCSRSRGTPVVAEGGVCDQYLAEFNDMIISLKLTDQDKVIVSLDSLCKNLCLTTIFGLFLQYPYVYYTSDSGNCLAGVELILVELGSPEDPPQSHHVTNDGADHVTNSTVGHVFTSFSVPKSLCQTEEELTSLRYYLRHRMVCLDSVAM